MPIDNPNALVEEFKKSGEFDRVRGELLLEFQKDESYAAFKTRIEDIVRQRLAKAAMLHYLPQDLVLKELTQEVERYPIVERAVADVRMFSDPTFLANVESSLQKVLQDERLDGKLSIAPPKEDEEPAPGQSRTPVIQNEAELAGKDAPNLQRDGDDQQEVIKMSNDTRDSENTVPTLPRLSSPGLPPSTSAPSPNLVREDASSTSQPVPPGAASFVPEPPVDPAPLEPILDTEADDGQQDMDVDAD